MILELAILEGLGEQEKGTRTFLLTSYPRHVSPLVSSSMDISGCKPFTIGATKADRLDRL